MAVLFAVVLALSVSWVTSQTSVCTFVPNSNPVYTAMNLEATAIVNSGAVTGTSPNYVVDNGAIDNMGVQILKVAGAGPDIQIDFSVEMYDTSQSPDEVNITLTVTNLDPTTITLASMEIDIGNDMVGTWDVGIPPGADLKDRYYVGYNASNLANGDSVTIHFLAKPDGKGGTDLPLGPNEFSANIYFTYLGTDYGIFLPSICVEPDVTVENSIVYEHGFTALTFFILFFVGMALAIFGIWLFLRIRQKRRESSVSPSKSDDKRMREKGRKIVMDAKAAMKRGANAIKDFSLIEWNDSIVIILALKDKLHMNREIDNLDILSTINIDTDLETEQIDASVQASQLLVQGFRHNGDISKANEDKANSNMQTRIKDLDKKLDTDYKKELESVYIDLEAKNKEKLGDLMRKHKEQRQDAVRVVKDLSETEKKQMMELLDQQQQTEENELTYKLALEQNEEAEKLRKEFAVRKRMGIKEIEQQYMKDVVEMGELNAEKADWLIKQHKQQQEEIHRKYDDEISRQRMNLEEKLARRRALAAASESQEDDHVDSLTMISSIQFRLLEKLQKKNNLTSEEIDEYMKQARADLQSVKDNMDKEKETKQQELYNRLSQVKRKNIAEKLNLQSSELQSYITKSKAEQTEGPVDPVSYVDGLVNLKSRHRKELSVLENEIDEAQAKELEVARDQIAENAKQELKAIERKLIEKVKSDGMRDDVIDKLLKEHEKSMNDLTAKQLNNRRNHEAKLKDELARRKREWEDRRAKEKQEQEDLREHEAEIVDKLLCSQVSISEAERDRILKEHEKQMVKLENSLTLNKLKQKRMLEEKIAQRRARQMEELQQKQNVELVKQRKIAENNGEEDDEETHKREMMLMKKHAEQRIALIQGMDFNFEVELEEIRVEMTKERALSLKEQEERLGALITSLQMDKAREMAKIEEQQKAINSLKANLMDDLNSRGILSTPECERILNIHKEEKDKLNNKLDNLRTEQEKKLRAKLQERLQQRENNMLQKQESEMKQLMDQAVNKTNAKIRRMILIHKHMVQMEKFRNKMDREISQTLENTKRDFEYAKQKNVQEQELKFIAGLIKVGDFNRNELIDVLHMLFPGKTEEAITDLLNTIYEEDKMGKKDKLEKAQSTLAERIYMAQYSNPTPLHRRGSVMSMTATNSASSKRLSKKGSKMSITSREDSMKTRNQFGPQDDYARSIMQSQFAPQDDYTSYSKKSQYGRQEDSYGYNAERQPYSNNNKYNSVRRQSSNEERRSSVRRQYSNEDDDDDYRDRVYNSTRRRYDDEDEEDDDDDDYRPRRNNRYDEDDEEDYIGRAVSTSQPQQYSNYSGRLPPLKEPGSKKKKRGLLKSLAH